MLHLSCCLEKFTAFNIYLIINITKTAKASKKIWTKKYQQ